MVSLYFYSILLLGAALAAGYLFVRLPPARGLFIPSSLAAGIFLLVMGPQVAGRYFPEWQIASEFYELWSVLPRYMITLVFAALFLGKPLLNFRDMWKLAGPQVAFGQSIAWGQYAVAGLLTLFVLTPLLGMPHITAALLEISFEGGHGTVAGMAPVFEDLDFETGRQIATGLATASLLSALLIGIVLINWARRTGHLKTGGTVRVARNKVYYHHIVHELRKKGVSLRKAITIRSLSSHLILLGISVLIGWLIHQGLLLIEARTWGQHGTTFFGYVPLFTFAMFGGMIAQIFWKMFGLTISREIIELISSLTLTLLIMAAIGTMSLEFLVTDGLAFVLIYAAGVAWVLFMFFAMARRMFHHYWFQNAIISFGQSMGMTATGLLFAQMVDPKNRTNAVEGFAYKQLMFEPFVGGGVVTALSMPFILLIGLPMFTSIAIGITIGWIVFGVLHFRPRKKRRRS